MLANITENEGLNRKKIEIGCPMEETCADIRIINEYFSKVPLKKNTHKYKTDFIIILILILHRF
jgi:hypothetical protein